LLASASAPPTNSIVRAESRAEVEASSASGVRVCTIDAVDGRTLPDAELSLAGIGGEDAAPVFERTGADGCADFTHASSTARFLSARVNGYGTVLDEPVAAQARTWTLELVPAGSVQGRVRDDRGDPVASAALTLSWRAFDGREIDLSADQLAAVHAHFATPPFVLSTDDKGAYALSGLPAGAGMLVASHDGIAAHEQPLALGPALVLKLDDLVLVHPVTINGRVLDATGTPVAAADVMLRCNGDAASSTHSRNDGRFAFEVPWSKPLPAQWEMSCDLLATSAGAQPAWTARATINTRSGGRYAIDLKAGTHGPSVHGRVRDERGRPVAGAVVKLSNVHLFAQESATTDADGNFQIDELPAGPFKVEVTHALHLSRAFYWREPPTDPVALTVFGHADVEGQVSDGENAIIGAQVQLSGGGVTRRTRTRALGKFHFSAVPLHDPLLTITDRYTEPYQRHLLLEVPNQQPNKPIEVGTFGLGSKGMLTGRVTGSDRKAISNAQVALVPIAFKSSGLVDAAFLGAPGAPLQVADWSHAVRCDAAGRFRIAAAPGSYALVARRAPGAAPGKRAPVTITARTTTVAPVLTITR
jgi:protocatechuate 3,4-dioxygenase beta subunit